jgi:hypothetical protein
MRPETQLLKGAVGSPRAVGSGTPGRGELYYGAGQLGHVRSDP